MNIFTLSYRGRLIKTLVVMKLTLLLVIVACFNVSASVYAQGITLNERNAPLSTIFKKIEKQSGYSFFYKNDLLKQTNPVTIHIEDASLTETLEQCFNSQPLTYDIVDNTIIVKKRQKSILQKVKRLLSAPLNIKGRVADTAGHALLGAVIKVKGTSIAVSANDKGEFEINGVDENAVLIITYVGYITAEVPINEAKNAQLRIVLKQNVGLLESVNIVSTGYQTIPKERATGSFSQPNKQFYDARVSTDVISKLDGITSGLVFNTTGITSSNTPKLSVRGRSTIYANDNPLIVVDNFPYDGDLANINPNDVESVTVLKDAAAASIWGVQAGNGVIVITTKRGKQNEALKVQFNSNITTGDKPDLYYNRNFLSSREFIEVERYLYGNGFFDNTISLNDPADPNATYKPLSPVVNLLHKATIGTISQAEADKQINSLSRFDLRDDLQKFFYRKSVNQQYALSLSGGNDKATYYLSTGYDKNLLSQVGSQFDRVTVNSQNSFHPFKPITVIAGINYVQTNAASDNTLSAIRAGGGYITSFPYTRLADDEGDPLAITKDYTLDFAQAATNKSFLDWQFKPLEELRGGFNTGKTQTNDLRLSTGAQYKLLKGLNADVKYQYQKTLLASNSLGTIDSYYVRNLINQYSTLDANGMVAGRNVPLGGIQNQYNSKQESHHFRAQLDYSYTSNRSQLAAIAGYELTQVKLSGNSNLLYGYDPELGISSPVDYINGFTLNPGNGYGNIPYGNTTAGTLDRYRSYFANASYTLDDKYTLSASGRIDASNYFGVKTNQKAVPLWSAGVKWDISKEQFYHLTWLPILRLRSSYGYQGNLDRSLSAFNTMYYFGSPARFSNATYGQLANVGNPDLRWEKSRMINLGVEFATSENKITGTLEAYYKKGIDLIGYSVLAPSTGILEMKGNYSGMSGRGIDFQVNSDNIKGKFNWSSNFIFSRATDKVTGYTGNPIVPSQLVGDGKNILPVIGKPVYGLYSYKWAGINPVTGNPQGNDNNGNVSTDYSLLTNPQSIDQIIYNGPARPVIFGGFGNRFAYGNITLAFNISYKFGYYFRRSALNYYSLFYQGVGNTEFNNRWLKPGDEAHTNVPSMLYPSDQNRDYFYNSSEATVEKGDHIRLQDITLSYNLLQKNIPSLPFTSIKFYAYANNIGILWRANKLGLDPDYPTSGWPNPRTISLGIKATL